MQLFFRLKTTRDNSCKDGSYFGPTAYAYVTKAQVQCLATDVKASLQVCPAAYEKSKNQSCSRPKSSQSCPRFWWSRYISINVPSFRMPWDWSQCTWEAQLCVVKPSFLGCCTPSDCAMNEQWEFHLLKNKTGSGTYSEQQTTPRTSRSHIQTVSSLLISLFQTFKNTLTPTFCFILVTMPTPRHVKTMILFLLNSRCSLDSWESFPQWTSWKNARRVLPYHSHNDQHPGFPTCNICNPTDSELFFFAEPSPKVRDDNPTLLSIMFLALSSIKGPPEGDLTTLQLRYCRLCKIILSCI